MFAARTATRAGAWSCRGYLRAGQEYFSRMFASWTVTRASACGLLLAQRVEQFRMFANWTVKIFANRTVKMFAGRTGAHALARGQLVDFQESQDKHFQKSECLPSGQEISVPNVLPLDRKFLVRGQNIFKNVLPSDKKFFVPNVLPSDRSKCFALGQEISCPKCFALGQV